MGTLVHARATRVWCLVWGWCFGGGHPAEPFPPWCACVAAGVLQEGFSKGLLQPTPFAAVDSINYDESGRLRFHYVVVEVRRGLMWRSSGTEPEGLVE